MLKHASNKWDGQQTAAASLHERIAIHAESDGAPNYVIAYALCCREWDVKVLDWHTQHSTLAGPDGITSKLKRLMPIVGCEADAVAFEEEERYALRVLPEALGEAKTVWR